MTKRELCGLQWQDIDFDKGIIYIRHTLVYVRTPGQPRGKSQGKADRRHFELQSPKTEAGERYVVIPSSLLGILKEHRTNCEDLKEKMGSNWNPDDMVFLTIYGNFYAEQYLNTKFKKFAKKIGLPDGRSAQTMMLSVLPQAAQRFIFSATFISHILLFVSSDSV